MDLIADLFAYFLTATLGLVAPQTAPLERTVERTYEVAAGALVHVDLSGGRILVVPTTGRAVRLTLLQRIHTRNERDADAALEDYTVELEQRDGDVYLTARRTQGASLGLWRPIRVNMDAELAVPDDVALNLETSGGSIEVGGTRAARLDARTAGGSITVEDGLDAIEAETSGGSIRIGRVSATARARTSGGSIRIADVAATATDVEARTSGGSVHIGVSRDARLTLDASTSGGSVSVEGLPIAGSQRSRSRLTGTLNGGGGQLVARTSGGSVRISAN